MRAFRSRNKKQTNNNNIKKKEKKTNYKKCELFILKCLEDDENLRVDGGSVRRVDSRIDGVAKKRNKKKILFTVNEIIISHFS